MPESLNLLQEVAKLREKQDEQADIVNALLRHQAGPLKEELLSKFRKDRTLCDILLLVDGELSQQQILLRLQQMGSPNANKAGVSRRIDRLANELGLIRFVERSGEGKVYRKSGLDGVLGVSKALARR